MREYRVVLHRTVVLEEEWNVIAESDAQAAALVVDGDGDYVGETTLECLATSVLSTRRRRADPDLDIDEGL